jgi:ribokinase
MHNWEKFRALLVAIGWRAVANRVWQIPNFDGKFPQCAERKGGGFGMQACRQAVALGAKSVLLTAVGDDANGAALQGELAATGADLSGVQIVPAATTTKAEVVQCNGSRAVLIDEGLGGVEWRPNGSDWRLIEGADAICIGGTLPDDVVAEVCEQARRLNKPLCANPTRLDRPSELDLRGVRMLQVSQNDAPNFGLAPQAPAGALADMLLARGADVVVVTAGARGASAFDLLAHSMWMPALPQRVEAHPTGAGDAHFMAAALGILSGLPLWDSLELASLAGAFFVENGRAGSLEELAHLAHQWPLEKRVRDFAQRIAAPTEEAVNEESVFANVHAKLEKSQLVLG